jgi:hypothetical protein
MNLLDGLSYYKKDAAWLKLTLEIEEATVEVVRLVSGRGYRANSRAATAPRDLLIRIEEWKAMCLKEQMGNAAENSEEAVWNAFRGALNAENDLEAILSIMNLKGFGSSYDEDGIRRAKRASAVLRFLKPHEWGVVDWRTSAMLGFLKKAGSNVDQAVTLAKKEKAGDLREAFDRIDERGACAVNDEYREMHSDSLVRAADVDMALFGLSMMAWPMR